MIVESDSMITKETTDRITADYCECLVESLNTQNLKDLSFYVGKLQMYQYVLNEDQIAILYEGEQRLDAMTSRDRG
mgnify:FL=1